MLGILLQMDIQQECIPVWWAPSAAVAVSGGVSVWSREGGVCPGVSEGGYLNPPLTLPFHNYIVDSN